MRLLVFGYGFTARAFAARLRDRIAWLGATARSDLSEGRLREAGLDTVHFDATRPGKGIRAALEVASHVLVSIPPDAEGDPVLRYHKEDLRQAAAGLDWIGYLSTVGVYGDHDGAWVTEESECRPVSTRSKNRLKAEQEWQDFAAASNVPTGIFRLAGIYGPGRNQLRSIMAGKARRLIKPGQVFNRIHVEDIAAVLEAAVSDPLTEIYNVADNEPAPPQDVVAYGAELLGLEPPPEVPFDPEMLSPMAQSFYGENKRVSNAKIRNELGVALTYPSYREGLKALLEIERGGA